MFRFSIRRFSIIASVITVVVAFVSFRDTAAQTQERGLKIKVGATSGELKTGGRDVGLSAVLIGVSLYQYGDQDLDGSRISNLKHAAEDCEAMRDFLMSPEGGGFKEDHIVNLQDEAATKASVQSGLAGLRSEERRVGEEGRD